MPDSNPVSAWAATAPYDISRSTLLLEKSLEKFSLQLYSGETSIWLVATFPDGGRIGFRSVFALGAVMEGAEVTTNDGRRAVIEATCRLGDYKVELDLMDADFPTFRSRTTFTPREDIFIPFSPRDVVPLPENGQVSRAKGTVHVTQEGTRSGHLYFSIQSPAKGSVFYFQDLSSISDYADFTQTSPGGSVGGNWPEVGFSLPAAIQKPLPAGKPVVVSDAIVLLTEDYTEDSDQAAKNYLDYLAAVYPLINKPQTTYNDWPAIAARGLQDLKDNKGCWTQAEGKSYLNAYVCDYDTPPEIMVQLAVLVPLHEYFEWKKADDPIIDQIRAGLPAFFDEKLGCVCRWLPSLQFRLDRSEEQKKEDVMDSWYLHHPLMNLARLADRHDSQAKKLLLDSLDFVVKVAQRFKYQWPVFYKMDTLEVVKAETKPGKGGEKDVPGAYAHVMLQARDLTGDKKFFDEAVKAVKKLEGVGFEIFYQANNTAFSAVTLLRLYKETNDKKYLELSYTCLACLFRNMQLWEGRYGYGKHYSRFFSIYPLSDAPYIAPYEELEVYAALTYYLNQSVDIDLRPSVRLLMAEFVRFFVYRMPYYYPGNLPKEVLSEEVKTGEIDANLLIPLEDLRDGWEKSGQVGQEVYGAAGAGFGIVPRQYFKCGDSDILLYSDYPVFRFRNADGSSTFELGGDPDFECRIRIIGKNATKCSLEPRPSGDAAKPLDTGRNWAEYAAMGQSKWRVVWKKSK